MRINGFVELTNELDPEVLRSLAVGAYRISSQGQVTLALSDVPERIVDRCLDPVVRADACHACGVRYLQGRPLSRDLLDRANGAGFVIATSPELRSALDALGVRHMNETDGIAYLAQGIESAPAWQSFRRSTATI